MQSLPPAVRASRKQQARLNEARLSVGKPSLGFLNPLLYSSSMESALHDVTTGCNSGENGGRGGFYAAAGWDPVTGLGTPDYTEMLHRVRQLP
eukprot:COSAG05_NODE_336_length_11205_cov_4.160544_4_plen_93_part_00